jgi:cysteinyl-tRNA synthetase
VPGEVLRLVEARQEARGRKDWAASDALRAQIAALGWQVKDTPDGPVVEKG